MDEMTELKFSLETELEHLKDRLKKTASAIGFFTSEAQWVEKISGLCSAISYIETRLEEEF